MSTLQKSVPVNEIIYSKVVAMQLTNAAAMAVKNVFKHELTQITTSILNDEGALRPAKSKADLKRR